MHSPQPILWDVYEEHVDEAAFVWSQWERAFGASNYTVPELAAGPEERLLAHLEGLLIGGAPVCERLMLAALEADEPALCSVAAWVLLHADHADLSEVVWRALVEADGPRRHAVARVLELSDRADVIERWLSRVGRHGPNVDAAIIDAAAMLVPSALAGLPLWEASSSGNDARLAALLRAFRYAPRPPLPALVEYGLRAEQDELRAAAIEAATLLGVSSPDAACRLSIAQRSPSLRLALAVLAIRARGRDCDQLLTWSLAGEIQKEALWALAFTGRIDVAERLLERLDDTLVAASAAEAFGAIVGLVIEGRYALQEQPGPRVAELDSELDDDAPIPELRPEDDLALPDPDALRRWWKQHANRFDPAGRYVFGYAWDEPSLRRAFDAAPAWRRPGLRLALGAAGAPLNLRTWARRQATQE